MKRLPSLLRSTPPSPRTPSVTRMPRTLGGHTMPVGWNCTNSMSSSVAPGVIGERMAVAGVFPTVAGDLVRAADAAGRQHHRFGMKQLEAPALAVVPERAHHAAGVHQQRDDGALHVKIDALMDAVILQRADHLEAGAVAHVRQARIAMAAEIALQNVAVLGAIEQRAPGFQFAHARRALPWRAARPCGG